MHATSQLTQLTNMNTDGKNQCNFISKMNIILGYPSFFCQRRPNSDCLSEKKKIKIKYCPETLSREVTKHLILRFTRFRLHWLLVLPLIFKHTQNCKAALLTAAYYLLPSPSLQRLTTEREGRGKNHQKIC